MPIRVLSDVVAAQIAAGEVVERPASVVKELVENALDAGATSISIEIEEGGTRLIRISDDGTGIPSGEVSLAFHRHATSKLETVADLDHIATLGFRGEALASIAAVSRTTLVSRHREESSGITVQVDGGEERFARPTGAPAGTVVTVENLFFNTPARLKFLKSDSTERRHINQLVTRYAMAYPEVRFRLMQEGREQFHSTGSGDLADVLVEVFGLDTFKDMLEVSPQPAPRRDVPAIDVYGYASAPSLYRANRGHIVLFVNGRAIVDQSLTYAVVQAYHALLPDGRYPLAVLMITLAPEEVDVNVHPTKAEVRFRAPDAVFAAVQRAVRAVLVDMPSAREYGGRADQGHGTWDEAGYDAPVYPARPRVPGEEQLRMALPTDDPGRFTRAAAPGEDTAIPSGPGQPLRPRTLPIMRVIGQVGAMYIVAEGPAGLYLIDQHAAHARVLYEQFRFSLAQGDSLPTVALSSAATELPPRQSRLLETESALLASVGIDVELFGPNTFRLRAVPDSLAEEDPARILSNVAETLEMGGEDALDNLLQTISYLGAYKAGQTLDFDAMASLVQRLERCETPRTDPDNQPTLIHISGEELARQFKRA